MPPKKRQTRTEQQAGRSVFCSSAAELARGREHNSNVRADTIVADVVASSNARGKWATRRDDAHCASALTMFSVAIGSMQRLI
jgi:hypothetical protein